MPADSPSLLNRVTRLERKIKDGLTLARLTLTGALTGAAATFTSLTVGGVAFPTSGTYTPTLTNTTNITSSTAELTRYTRVGNYVYVFGRVTIQSTAAGGVVMGMSLPIASNIANLREVAGTAAAAGNTFSIEIRGDTTNDRATIAYTAAAGSTIAFYFHFGYEVI